MSPLERPRKTRCLILDIAMPDMTGPELRTELRRHCHDISVVFITAHRDESIRPLGWSGRGCMSIQAD
ncbi:response regulator [Mesorhizobium sp. CA9]|nr:response regulator [Mesorhizobium sp. CA9]MBZ9839631.1 response regulator [Mesorhizobium sp. CA3]MBZ9879834.1 response regulator [Mesorhizobium sp. Ca11]MBZ9885104.1 response regulator [Mesorhizobium sp. CA10]